MEQNQPLVTIITNTKNRANLIHRCIESIQKQTYQHYEHIIADGGTDNTEEIVKSYNDPKIKYIKVPEGGPIAQTKEAFILSKGEYITFLDDDDEYLPLKIEKQLELIKGLPYDYGFIYGSMTYYDYQTGKQLHTHEANYSGGDLLPIAVSRPIICGTPTFMFKRHVFESIGGTWISGIGNPMSDWALGCKAIKQGWKVGALKESYLKIYVNHGSERMSPTKSSKESAEKGILLYSHFLNEYNEVYIKYPKTKYYVQECFFKSLMTSGRLKDGLKAWVDLVKIRAKLRTIGLLFKYCIVFVTNH